MCNVLRTLLDDAEKESAFRGLCAMVEINPGVRYYLVILLCAVEVLISRPSCLLVCAGVQQVLC